MSVIFLIPFGKKNKDKKPPPAEKKPPAPLPLPSLEFVRGKLQPLDSARGKLQQRLSAIGSRSTGSFKNVAQPIRQRLGRPTTVSMPTPAVESEPQTPPEILKDFFVDDLPESVIRRAKFSTPKPAKPIRNEEEENDPQVVGFRLPQNLAEQGAARPTRGLKFNERLTTPDGRDYFSPTALKTRQIEAQTLEDDPEETVLLKAALPDSPTTPPANINPADLVPEPIYDPNSRRIKAPQIRFRRPIIKFDNPAVALGAGVVSLMMLVVIVAAVGSIGRLIDRASPEKFAVVFTQFGDTTSYNSFANGIIWQKAFSDNFVRQGAVLNADARVAEFVVKTGAEAYREAERSASDVVVSGYYDQANGKLITTLGLAANGPYDLPTGRGKQIIERHLYDPDYFVFVTAPPSDTTERLPLTVLIHAISAYYNGAYDVAIRELTSLLGQAEPANEPGLRMLRANVLFVSGRYAEAIEDYNQLININETSLAKNLPMPISPAFVYNNRAVAFNWENSPEPTTRRLEKQAANRDFETALATNSNLPKIYVNYAQLVTNQTDIEFQPTSLSQWQTNLTKSVTISPKLTSGYEYLGRILRFEGKFDEAIAMQNKVRSLDINYIESYEELGLSYLGKYAVNNDPQLLTSAVDAFGWGEARATTMLDQSRQRWQSLTQAGNIALAATWDGRSREAENLQKTLRFDLARAHLERTRLAGKELGNPFDRLGRAIRGQKTSYEQAGPVLEAAVKDPTRVNDPDVNFYYGQFLEITGDGDPAPYYKKVKELETNPNRRFRYQDIIAKQYLVAQKNDAAINEYVEYIKLYPQRVEGYLALSNLQYRLGQFKEAASSADAAIRIAPNNAQAYLAAGAAQIGSLQPEQGSVYLERALVLDPNLLDAHLQRGIALYNLNKRREALSQFNEVFERSDTYPQANYFAGIIYQETLNDPTNALLQWQQAVKTDPKYVNAWVKIGQLYSQMNQLDKALNAYNQALAINEQNTTVPSPAINEQNATVHYYVGLLQENLNTKDSLGNAEAQYRRSIELNPGLVNAYNHLALVVLIRSGNITEALQIAQKAIDMDQTNPEAQVALGDLLRTQGENDKTAYSKAIEAYSAALVARKDYPEAIYGRAAASYKLGQLDSALSDLNLALKLKPNWSEAYLLQGQVYVLKGQYDTALISYGAANRADTRNPNVYVEIGKLREIRNEPEAAIIAYKTALSIKEALPEAYFRLGIAYFISLNNPQEAVTRFERVLTLDSKARRIYYWLGRTYAGLKRNDDAQKALETMIAQEPNFIEAHFELGNVYRAKGSNEQAIVQYDKATSLQPSYGPAWLNKAQVYESLSDITKAREAYQNALKSTDTQIKETANTALLRLGK